MLVIRDIMHCKPGKVRPMVEKFLALKALGKKSGMGAMRIMTDLAAEQYWTVVVEIEVKSIEEFMAMGSDKATAKKMEQIMKGYHDLVKSGRREIFTLEK